MEIKQPTQEQIKEFWEWCGFKNLPITTPDGKGGWQPHPFLKYWLYPDGKEETEPPYLDLNNLFKYAVPKLRYGEIKFSNKLPSSVKIEQIEGKAKYYQDNDPALALFWAIWEVIHGTK